MTQKRDNSAEYLMCPKCKEFSGDDWSQCGKGCPVEGSPHFTQDAVLAFGPLLPKTSDEFQAAMTTRWDRDREEEVAF